MEASVVLLPKLKLVGLKVVGRRSELSHRVPLAWTDLVRCVSQMSNRVDPDVFYGAFPESDHLNDGTHGVYTYFVCTEVTEHSRVPEGMIPLEIPPQRCVRTRVQGTAEAIDAAYMGLFRWVGEQGMRTNQKGWGLERYDQRLQKVTPPYERFDYDILKPVE
ncbi:MAG: GyrI-like domain-containing protein [Myxococcaceae bacterium]